MSHPKVICIITPYATSSRTTQEELDRNEIYAQLLTSQASMLPGVEVYCPTLQYSALPENYVESDKISKESLYKHCKENAENELYGWRSSMGLQKKADEIWFGADCGLVPPSGVKHRNVSIKNLVLVTKHPGYIKLIEEMTKDILYPKNTIDIVQTLLHSQNGEINYILI